MEAIPHEVSGNLLVVYLDAVKSKIYIVCGVRPRYGLTRPIMMHKGLGRYSLEVAAAMLRVGYPFVSNRGYPSVVECTGLVRG